MQIKLELGNMKKIILFILPLVLIAALLGWSKGGYSQNSKSGTITVSETITNKRPIENPYAIFAGGCFWCIESEFRALDGVTFTESGYIGGETDNPTNRDISTGESGHAEAIRIYYNP